RDLHPGARLLHGQTPRRLEIRLPAPVAVLRAVGPAAVRPRHARLAVRSRIHAALWRQGTPAAESLCTRLEYPDADRLALRLALGLHTLRRGLAGAAGRGDALHRRRQPDQP